MAKSWRHWVRVVHRDVGYFLSALVVAYSVSGAAVNHMHEWNPSYGIDHKEVNIGPLSGDMDAMQATVAAKLDLNASQIKGRHLVSATRFVVFLQEGGEAKINPKDGSGSLKLVTPRPVLYDFNVLHLNHIKGAWTWFADGMALLLLTLAITGLFMLRGKLGFAGRGKWFVLAGLLVPIAFLTAHYYST